MKIKKSIIEQGIKTFRKNMHDEIMNKFPTGLGKKEGTFEVTVSPDVNNMHELYENINILLKMLSSFIFGKTIPKSSFKKYTRSVKNTNVKNTGSDVYLNRSIGNIWSKIISTSDHLEQFIHDFTRTFGIKIQEKPLVRSHVDAITHVLVEYIYFNQNIIDDGIPPDEEIVEKFMHNFITIFTPAILNPDEMMNMGGDLSKFNKFLLVDENGYLERLVSIVLSLYTENVNDRFKRCAINIRKNVANLVEKIEEIIPKEYIDKKKIKTKKK